jgi:hypothetical protein
MQYIQIFTVKTVIISDGINVNICLFTLYCGTYFGLLELSVEPMCVLLLVVYS